jgi:pyruvate formate lyase activating enzyme
MFERNRAFYRHGGITVTGGEPLAQPGFVGALFEAAHSSPAGRVHTCLDTSGAAWDPERPDRFERLLANTDLVLLDIKHSDAEGHRDLCGRGPERPLAFGDELARRRIPTVIRHVVVPGITDDPDELAGVGRIMARWDNVVGLDVLPYHTMGEAKYEALGIPYRLAGVEPMDPGRVPSIRKRIMEARAAALGR